MQTLFSQPKLQNPSRRGFDLCSLDWQNVYRSNVIQHLFGFDPIDTHAAEVNL